MRSIASTANGGRPRLPSGAYGAISITRSAHGTTRFISPKNSRLRVRFVDKFSPRSVHFMAYMFACSPILDKHIREPVMHSIPNHLPRLSRCIFLLGLLEPLLSVASSPPKCCRQL